MSLGCDEAQVAHSARLTERTFLYEIEEILFFKVLRIGNNDERGYTRVEHTEF
jgi:hypothetical protein